METDIVLIDGGEDTLLENGTLFNVQYPTYLWYNSITNWIIHLKYILMCGTQRALNNYQRLLLGR